MIKFFRHIRQSLIMENKTAKYLKYAIGEIVLVVIGILIALQINNWNEERKELKKSNAYLLMLSDELETNLTRLDLAMKWAKEHREYNLNTLTELNSDSAKSIDLERLYVITTSKGPFSKIELIRSSFDDMINSGTMENVKDSLLRKRIFSIESSIKRFDNAVIDIRVVWEEQLRPYHIEHLDESRIIGLGEFGFETDVDAFVYNRKYANILTGNIIFINNYENAIEDIKKSFMNTLANIRSYLNKDQVLN